jgi:hypothetical protein
MILAANIYEHFNRPQRTIMISARFFLWLLVAVASPVASIGVHGFEVIPEHDAMATGDMVARPLHTIHGRRMSTCTQTEESICELGAFGFANVYGVYESCGDAPRRESAWCYSVTYESDACCGDEDDCCVDDPVGDLVTLLVIAAIITASVLACCKCCKCCCLYDELHGINKNGNNVAGNETGVELAVAAAEPA